MEQATPTTTTTTTTTQSKNKKKRASNNNPKKTSLNAGARAFEPRRDNPVPPLSSTPVLLEQPAEQQKQPSTKSRTETKQQPPPPKPPRKREWWHSLKDVCPITLQRLSELPYAPFEVAAEGDVKHRFDPVALADYVITTGNFQDPVNRKPLSRAECDHLDAHLRRIGRSDKARVMQALEVQATVVAGGSSHPTDARLRDAGVIMHQLFHYPSVRDSVGREGGAPPVGAATYDARRGGYVDSATRTASLSSRNRREAEAAARAASAPSRREGGIRLLDDDDQWEQLPPEVTMERMIDRHPALIEEFPSLTGSDAHRGASLSSSSSNARPMSDKPMGALVWGVNEPAQPPPLPREPRRGVDSDEDWRSAAHRQHHQQQQQHGGSFTDISASRGGSFTALPSHPRIHFDASAVDKHLFASAPSEKTSQVFGNARPREENLAARAVKSGIAPAPPMAASDLSSTTYRLERLVKQDSVMYCPYPPSMLRQARGAYTWLVSCERQLMAFVQGELASRTSMNFEPGMSPAKRRLLMDYVSRFWGMMCHEVDPEPHRFVSAMIGSTPPITPAVTLSRAVLMFPDLAECDYEGVEGGGYGLNSPGIAFWGMSNGAANLKLNGVYLKSTLERIGGVRESEVEIYFLDLSNAVVVFASSERARRVFKKMEKLAGAPDSLTWERAQYWPMGGVEWARYQFRLYDEARGEQREMERRAKVLSNVKDAWEVDEESDEYQRPQGNEGVNKVGKARRTGKNDTTSSSSMMAKRKNAYGALAEDDDEEEEEEDGREAWE